MELLSKAYRIYDYYNTELADPRTNHFPLIGSPFYVILLAITYNYFVQNLGPKLMAKRKPFVLKNVMILYNTIQILCNAYIVYKAFAKVWIPMRHSLMCEPVDYSNDPLAMEIVYHGYFYFLLKISDLLDTIFMVLKKKGRQITFLHTYHHTVMILAVWIALKYFAGICNHTSKYKKFKSIGGILLFFVTLNTFVHTVMYLYYLLTTISPKYKQSIGLKRRITELQLIQFAVTSIHGSLPLIENCGYPKWLTIFGLLQMTLMTVLFLNFYRKTYLNKEGHKAKPKINTD